MKTKRTGLLPAAFALLALPFSRTRTEERIVRAVYLFHRSGDPLATAAADEAPPLEPSVLMDVVSAMREFVQPESFADDTIRHVTLRFGEDTLVAVRGRDVNACAVFRGRGDGALRRDLGRFVREFEERNEANLATWDAAVGLGETASRELLSFLGPIALSGDASGDEGHGTAST